MGILRNCWLQIAIAGTVLAGLARFIFEPLQLIVSGLGSATSHGIGTPPSGAIGAPVADGSTPIFMGWQTVVFILVLFVICCLLAGFIIRRLVKRGDKMG